MQEHFLPQIRI